MEPIPQVSTARPGRGLAGRVILTPNGNPAHLAKNNHPTVRSIGVVSQAGTKRSRRGHAMSEPTSPTPPTESREPAEDTTQPVTEPKLDVRPPWTIRELASEDLPKELVGAYLHG